ncbi:MAG: hypothetical protein PHD61_08715 [Bacteroidales bacterium]|nr:hypothetical protein [Lentimicrobiaceae bacterium]MDD5695371.1 hypothetical protein [Bacteroidales bacterium]
MKTKYNLILLMIMAGYTLFFTSCKDTFTETRIYMAYVPEYMSYDELRTPVEVSEPRAIETMGKIYIKGNYLFVNEKYEGIHVFDNSDPSHPVDLSFIQIPGNVDLAIMGNFLYADSYIDLVVMDISDITHPEETFRLEDVFPYTIPDVESDYPIAPIDQEKGVITGWSLEEYTEEYEGDIAPPPIYYWDRGSDVWLSYSNSESGGDVSQTVGVGGSLARCIIAGSTLYVLNQLEMQQIDLSVADKPAKGPVFYLSRIAETVFIDGTFLYIGTQTGMLLYDIKQPSWPVYVAAYDHFQSCDPVVVDQGIAYVTMRSGNRCGGWQNQMDVLNVSDPKYPILIKSYPMAEPFGLGIDHKTLFVCDGSAGLKIYDVSNPSAIDDHLIKIYPGIQARDVIPLNGILIMITTTGIVQYDYSDLNNIVEISKIPFALEDK